MALLVINTVRDWRHRVPGVTAVGNHPSSVVQALVYGVVASGNYLVTILRRAGLSADWGAPAAGAAGGACRGLEAQGAHAGVELALADRVLAINQCQAASERHQVVDAQLFARRSVVVAQWFGQQLSPQPVRLVVV